MGSAWLQRLFAPALILLMIGVLVLRDGDPGVHKRQIYVLGTQFQVTVPADQLSEPQFSAAMGQVNTRLHAFQHLWQPHAAEARRRSRANNDAAPRGPLAAFAHRARGRLVPFRICALHAESEGCARRAGDGRGVALGRPGQAATE